MNPFQAMARRVAQASMANTPSSDRRATEFATPEALAKYLKSHPNADKSKHSVKKDVSFVPKRHPMEVHKEVMALSPDKVKKEVKSLDPESKAHFEKVHGQLGHIEDADKRNQYALLETRSKANYERVETERKSKKAAVGRVADGNIVRWMQQAAGNLNKASGRLLESQGYVGGVTDLLVEALRFVQEANSDLSDSEMVAVVNELKVLLRRVDTETKSLSSAIREIQFKVIESRNQLGSEIAWELQHPSD